MSFMPDLTFYPSPGMAMKAAPERIDELGAPKGSRSEHLPGRAGRIAGPREGSHKRGRRHGGSPPAAPDGPHGPGCVREPSTAHRLLPLVPHRPTRSRAVYRLHVGHHAAGGAVLPPFS